MKHSVLVRSVVSVALISASAFAHANGTHEQFVDPAASLSFDGWNELNRNRTGGALTVEELVAGSGSNVAGSGDAVFTRVSGDHYPAGFGLYGGASTFTFTDTTVDAGATALVFQGIINDFDGQFGGTPLSLTLSYNGGSQAIAGTLVDSALNGGVSDYFRYTWDLSALGTPVGAYTLTLNAGFSQMLAFQIDQVAAVPEPETYALMLSGLGLIALSVRRRMRGV